jgi:hypothetical protein
MNTWDNLLIAIYFRFRTTMMDEVYCVQELREPILLQQINNNCCSMEGIC